MRSPPACGVRRASTSPEIPLCSPTYRRSGWDASYTVSARDDLLAAFRAEQAALAAEGRRHGSISRHKSSAGGVRENVVRDYVGRLMPQYGYLRGEISAPGLAPSREWDVIIYDRALGVNLQGNDEIGVVGIEAVLGVISVKSMLNGNAIKECADAAAELRCMLDEQPPGRHVPAVFAFGYKGLTFANLPAAIEGALEASGPLGAINGLLVLGDSFATALEGVDCFQEGQDAYARWISTLQDTLEVAPRAPVRLSEYLYEAPEAPPRASAQAPSRPDERDAVPSAEAAGAERVPADLLLLAERDRAGLATSRQLTRIRDELAQTDAGAAEAYDALLVDADTLEAAAADATGASLEAISRALLVLERSEAGAEGLLRRAAESDADRVELVALAADVSEHAEALLQEIEQANPDHPAPALRRALLVESPEQRLKALAAIEPTSARGQSVRAIAIATALSELGRDEDGLADAQAALATRWTPQLAERVAIMLLRARNRADQGEPSSYTEAAGLLAKVAVESLAIGQPDTALGIDARLVGVLCRAGRQELLGRLIEWWAENELEHRAPAARNAVTLSLLDCIEPQLARRVAPAEPSPEPSSQLVRARLALESQQPDEIRHAVTLLDELLADELDPFTRSQAAHARLLAAADFDADWSDEAARLIVDEKPLYVAALRAAHLSGRGQTKEAETILLPFTDTRDGKRALIDLLARQEQWTRVIGLIESLGPEAPAGDRVRRADALMRLGEIEQAEQAWRELVDQEQLPYLRREHAAFRLASSLSERQQWEQLAEFAAHWHRVLPGSPKAPWAAAEGLARIGKPVEALTMLDEAEVIPLADVERHLMAQLAAHALPLPEALQRIASLSDATDRHDELLESMLITVSAGQDKNEFPPELEARVRLTYSDFTERFPESKLIWSEKIDDDDERGWMRRLEEHAKRRHQFAQDIESQVVNGQGALTLLSLLGKRPLEVWMLSRVLPLAYPLADEQQAEQTAADSAIAGAASWDVSVLAISSLIDADLAVLLSSSLPASMLARSASAEVAHAQAGLAELDPARSPGTLAFDERTGEPQLIANDLETLGSMQARLERVAEMADRLMVRDPDAGGEAELARALRDQELDPSAATWLGAVALAQQFEVPFYCDDRYLRRWGRQLGVPSFGTVALLGALAERGALSSARYRTMLWQLRSHGGRYIPLLAGELIDQLRADGFEMSDATAATLLAPEGWGVEPNELLTAWHHALAATFVAQSERLRPLIGAVLRMGSRGRGASLSSTATMLVLSGLALPSPPAGYMRAFLNDLRRSYTPLEDPVDLAMASVAQQATGQPDASAIVLRALTRLPLSEQMRLLG